MLLRSEEGVRQEVQKVATEAIAHHQSGRSVYVWAGVFAGLYHDGAGSTAGDADRLARIIMAIETCGWRLERFASGNEFGSQVLCLFRRAPQDA